ncbi:PH domain-containing protein, partial [Trichostrongylus colubriformis]
EKDKLYKELEEASFFDCFSLDGPSNRWSCFSCSHRDRVTSERVKSFVGDDGSQRVLEGQLKEKKGRWRFLRRWHTKYFTLSSAALTCSSEKAVRLSNLLLNCIQKD